MEKLSLDISAIELAQHIADYLREMSRLSRERNLVSLAQLLDLAEIEAISCARHCTSQPAPRPS
jgi:hypothetical protein